MLCLSDISLEIGLCLFERSFTRTGVDREKKVSLFHILTLCKMNSHQFSSHLGLDRDRRASLDIPDGTDLDGYCFLDHRPYNDGDGGRSRLS